MSLPLLQTRPDSRASTLARAAPVAFTQPVLRLQDVGIGDACVNVQAYAGEIVHVSGGSAMARLRLLAMAAGLGHVGSGRCELLGHCLLEQSQAQRQALRERHVSRLLSCDHLPEAASVQAAVAMPLVRQGTPVEDALARAALELDALCAGALAGRRPATLSRTEARLALLARAMVARPRLLVLEQPEEALAPAAISAVRLALWALSSTFNTCVLMSTDHPRLMASADRFIDLDRSPPPQLSA